MDPRDKIFGLLGLTDPSNSQGLDLRIDYKITAAGVYTRFAISHLQQTGRLDILSTPRVNGQHGVNRLSTEVPDWSIWDGTTSLRWEELLPPGSPPQQFNASANTIASSRLSTGKS